MFSSGNTSSEFLMIIIVAYVMVAISVSRLGVAKACGGTKALFFSLFFHTGNRLHLYHDFTLKKCT